MENGIHELTPGYALDALDAEERRVYEAHLPDCQRCGEELASLASVTEALAVGASGPVPSTELRGRILADARAEPQIVVPFETRRRRAVPALAAAAAIAAVVALAVGLWAVRLSDELDDTRSALDDARGAAAVVADPDARIVSLQSGDGRLVVAADGRAALLLSGLDPAPSGKTYEVWVIEGTTPAPAGLFPGHEGAELVEVEGAVDAGDVVAVTVEERGGVPAPTTTPIVTSEPA
jgi:anti-sigma factor RsiW